MPNLRRSLAARVRLGIVDLCWTPEDLDLVEAGEVEIWITMDHLMKQLNFDGVIFIVQLIFMKQLNFDGIIYIVQWILYLSVV